MHHFFSKPTQLWVSFKLIICKNELFQSLNILSPLDLLITIHTSIFPISKNKTKNPPKKQKTKWTLWLSDLANKNGAISMGPNQIIKYFLKNKCVPYYSKKLSLEIQINWTSCTVSGNQTNSDLQ